MFPYICTISMSMKWHWSPQATPFICETELLIIGGRAWASMHCCCNILSRHTIMGNSRSCHCLLFYEHGKQNFMQQFHLSRKLLRYTHAWTKLHNNVMSWISGAYECRYAWPLPEVNATTVCDITVPSLSSLPLSSQHPVSFDWWGHNNIVRWVSK